MREGGRVRGRGVAPVVRELLVEEGPIGYGAEGVAVPVDPGLQQLLGTALRFKGGEAATD